MTKAELIQQNAELRAEIAQLNEMKQILISGGLEYQKRFLTAYKLLDKITGMNNHVIWLEIQDFLKLYEVIQHPTYGEKVIPK
jgi:hypothetical protein